MQPGPAPWDDGLPIPGIGEVLVHQHRHQCGLWGLLKTGTRQPSSFAEDFATWDLVGSTANTLLSYREDDLEARSILSGGVYTFVDSSTSQLAGWKIIVGGR